MSTVPYRLVNKTLSDSAPLAGFQNDLTREARRLTFKREFPQIVYLYI